MPRKSKSNTLLVGVSGTGEVTGKPGIEALVSDWVEEHTSADTALTFVFPFTDIESGLPTDALITVFDTVVELGIEVLGIASPEADVSEFVPDLAGPVHETSLVRKQMQTMLQEADSAACIVLWDDEDAETQALCLHLDTNDIPLYEMSTGLAQVEELVIDDGGSGNTNTPDEEEQPVADEEEIETEAEEAAEETEEFEPYTREELEELGEKDRDELKTIATEDFKLEIAPRVRTNTIIDMILAAQEELDLDADVADSGDAPEADDAPEEAPQAEAGAPFNTDDLVAEIVEETAALVKDLVEPLLAEIQVLQEAVEQLKQATAKAGASTTTSKAKPVRRRPPTK